MSPVIEKEGRFYLDRTEEIKLYLMWLSCKNFSALNETKNQNLLKETWADVKANLKHYFRNYAISLESIFDTFKKINLTIDPKYPCGYDPEKDILLFNLWSLFFSLTDDGFATSSPPWQIGGNLIHEFDHSLFFRRFNMIGKREKDYKEFEKEHLSELEKRAYSKQIDFLEKCKKNVPCEALSYKIKVRNWSLDGIAINRNVPVFRKLKNDEMSSIHQAICQIRDVVHKIDTGKSYDDFSTGDSISDHLKLVKLLSLPIRLNPKRKNYPRIEIDM